MNCNVADARGDVHELPLNGASCRFAVQPPESQPVRALSSYSIGLVAGHAVWTLLSAWVERLTPVVPAQQTTRQRPCVKDNFPSPRAQLPSPSPTRIGRFWPVHTSTNRVSSSHRVLLIAQTDDSHSTDMV